MAEPLPLKPVDQDQEDRADIQKVITELKERLDAGRLRGLVVVQLLDGPITHGCTYVTRKAGLWEHEAVYLLERGKRCILDNEGLLPAADQG